MRINLILIILIIIHSTLSAGTCDDIFHGRIESEVKTIINSADLEIKAQAKLIHSKISKLLDSRNILYKKSTFEGQAITYILPDSKSKLGRFASYLKNTFDYDLAFSYGMNIKIDGALCVSDENILLTSLQDIIRNEVGSGSRHELSHVWEAFAAEENIYHPILSSSIQGKKNMFNHRDMSGYETDLSFDETYAYANELHYSLFKFNRSSHKESKELINRDIEEASRRLKVITSQILIKLKQIKNSTYKNKKISDDDYFFYIEFDGQRLSIPKVGRSVDEHIDDLISYYSDLENHLLKTMSPEQLEVFFSEMLAELRRMRFNSSL